MTREQIQENTIKDWFLNKKRGTYILSVGIGKSKIIADILKQIENNYSSYDIPILIGINSTLLRDSELPKELKKWGFNSEVQIECFASLYKYKNKKIGLYIADEADAQLTPVYSEFFTNNSIADILLLTGTMSPEKRSLLEALDLPSIRTELRVIDAQEKGLLNNTNIFLHKVPLCKLDNYKFAILL